LIANSQLAKSTVRDAACAVLVAEQTHAPVEQQAILLQRASDNPAALAFLTYLGGADARAILSDYLYGLPQ